MAVMIPYNSPMGPGRFREIPRVCLEAGDDSIFRDARKFIREQAYVAGNQEMFSVQTLEDNFSYPERHKLVLLTDELLRWPSTRTAIKETLTFRELLIQHMPYGHPDRYRHLLHVALKIAIDENILDELLGEIVDTIFAADGHLGNVFFAGLLPENFGPFTVSYYHNKKDIDALDKVLEFFTAQKRKFDFEVEGEVCSAPFTDVLVHARRPTTMLYAALRAGMRPLAFLLLKYGARLITRPDQPLRLLCINEIPLVELAVSQVVRLPWNRLQEIPSNYTAEDFRESEGDDVAYISIVGVERSRVATPLSLQHLCRHVIRKQLNKRSELPAGIAKLPLAPVLKSYLALKF